MAFQFALTDRFQKHYKMLSNNEQKQITRKLRLLAENPLHPSLRTKRVQGTDDLFECSVNMDIRILWHYVDNIMILLVDIGHHDILKRY